ncbi:uncharacterized protein BO95DRAFT_429748 [Aspergillus brunneoviolaceus CBS 621.78]|uniref:Uncharacterized protein n=1 Tax=Aspergillus brunneoviolaceus CBS 621.78 TaxID=1450534 RepID=A0ACD1GFN7_9EURO|nr:hypothetical protein BO95DRAFT_429748 [Aspergillus brunneoviolaceus CBS 621.78]RAH48035.1 hypothetical protein BO95DRAFT_429748 [Aspergillus brunneoviolaceus CBS 621.78]
MSFCFCLDYSCRGLTSTVVVRRLWRQECRLAVSPLPSSHDAKDPSEMPACPAISPSIVANPQLIPWLAPRDDDDPSPDCQACSKPRAFTHIEDADLGKKRCTQIVGRSSFLVDKGNLVDRVWYDPRPVRRQGKSSSGLVTSVWFVWFVWLLHDKWHVEGQTRQLSSQIEQLASQSTEVQTTVTAKHAKQERDVRGGGSTQEDKNSAPTEPTKNSGRTTIIHWLLNVVVVLLLPGRNISAGCGPEGKELPPSSPPPSSQSTTIMVCQMADGL